MNAPWTGGQGGGGGRTYVDGSQASAQAVNQPEITLPMDGDSFDSTASHVAVLAATGDDYEVDTPNPAGNVSASCFIIEQQFEIAGDYFSPLGLDSYYDQAQYAPDYVGSLTLSGARLVGESTPRDIGNGKVRWTRTYAYMEFDGNGNYIRNEPESIPFSFPALGADTGTGTPFSPEFNQEVACRTEHVYFIFDGSNTPDLYLAFYPFNASAGPTFANPDNTITSDGSTSPSLSQYLSWVDGGYEICARESILRRWRGNIFEVVTTYTPAQ
jgi:hypothetical protein